MAPLSLSVVPGGKPILPAAPIATNTSTPASVVKPAVVAAPAPVAAPVAAAPAAAAPAQQSAQAITPQAFKALIVSKYPNGVASDGTKYADMDPVKLTQSVVSKFPNGVTAGGVKYSDYLKGAAVMPSLSANGDGGTDSSTASTGTGLDTLGVAKAVGNAITNNEQEAGGDIAAAIGGNTMAAGVQKQNQALSDSDLAYLKEVQTNRQAAINSGDKAAVDRYNQVLQNFHTSSGQSMSDLFPSLKKTNGQVIGDFAGVALDALLAGSYGEAASGAKFLPEAADFFGDTGSLTSAASKTAAAAEAAKAAATAGNIETVDAAGKLGAVTDQVVKPATALQKVTNFGTKVAGGAGVGYSYDVANNLQQGKAGAQAFTPGIGTAVGAATPFIGAAIQIGARAAGEAAGVSTGAGYGAIREGFNAAQEGGEAGTAFRSALRGNTSSSDIVDTAKDALGNIIDQRNEAYQTQLSSLKSATKTFDISPVQQKFDSTLQKFGVSVGEDGALDFSRSPGLGRYEGDVSKVANVLNDWGSKPGDRTVVGIDQLKQTLDDFRVGSSDSKKFDSLVTTLRNTAQGLIINEPGYKNLVSNYAETTGAIKDIQKGLSLGDKASTDTAFRKLTTTLRTNNEFRLQLVSQLNEETGGKLTAQIAGQQLSPIAPRGLAKYADTAGAVAAAAGGPSTWLPILSAAMTTSPRIVGEFVNALGWSAGKSQALISLISDNAIRSGAVAAKISGSQAANNGSQTTLGVPSLNN